MVTPIKQSDASLGLCAINIQEDGVALVRVSYSSEKKPELSLCEFIPYPDLDRCKNELTLLVKKHQLNMTPCSLVLSPHHYKLILLDPLPVAQNELLPALRWQIKNLIPFPIEDAIIDFFHLGSSVDFFYTGPPETHKLCVVITRASELKPLIAITKACHLNLSFIDIPEFALRNINALYSEDSYGMGFMMIESSIAHLVITHNKNLYVSRRINLPLQIPFLQNPEETKNEEASSDTWIFKIQQSFDYYQNQLHQPPPVRLLINQASGKFISHLSPQLSCNITPLNILEVLHYQGDCDASWEARFLMAIGGALRQENTYATTN